MRYLGILFRKLKAFRIELGLIPCNKQDVYKRQYLYYDGEIRGAIRLEEVQEIIKKGEYSVITDDKLQPILGGTSYQQITCQLGVILADIAENKNAEGNWRKLKPLYIQPPPGV